MALNGSLDHLIEDMKRLYAMAEAEAETKRIAYEGAKAEAKRLYDMLRVAGAVEAPVKKSKPKPAPKPETVSAETREKVLAAIRRHGSNAVLPDVPGSFTVDMLDAGVHSSSVRKAIYILRDEGIVRAVGSVPNGAPHKPTAYALIVGGEDDLSY